MSAKSSDSLGAPLPNAGGGTSFPILLAEDNQDDVWLWSEGLKAAGHEPGPFIVRDGVEAIDYLAGHGVYADRGLYPFPSLMLLDLSMPRRNGFEVLEWWKSAPHPRHLTIIVLTGSGMREDIERAYSLGAASYLMKPAHLPEVTEMARRALDFWRRSPAGQPLRPTGEPPAPPE